MENSENSISPQPHLEVSFPKSREDHRLQLVNINGSIFAIIHSALESNGPINLACNEWSLVILAPIVSQVEVNISAINIICLNEIQSKESTVTIDAVKKLFKLTPCGQDVTRLIETCEEEFQLEDDPGAFLNYFNLFHKVVEGAQASSPDSFFEAQQKFIAALCKLASHLDNDIEHLTIQKVLEIWNIAI